jgi:hypothetical protein
MCLMLEGQHADLAAQPRLVGEGGLGEVGYSRAVAEIDGEHRLVREGIADELRIAGAAELAETLREIDEEL